MGVESFGELLKEIVVGFWGYIKCWHLVDHFEEAVILRLGKYNRSLTPGLHPKWPVVEYGWCANVKPDTMEIEAVPVTTLDGKTISIGVMIDYEVINIKSYLIDNNDSLTNIIDRVKGETSDFIEEVNWAEIKKKTTKNALTRKLAPHLERMGVKLNDMKFTTKVEVRAYKIFTDKVRPNPTLSL